VSREEIDKEIEALVRDHQHSLKLCLRNCHFTETVIDEAIVDALLVVFQKRQRGQRIDRPENFLFTVALNSAKDKASGSRITEVLDSDLPYEIAPASDPAESVALSVDLGRAIAGLPDRQRQVIELRYRDGCSVSETARVLGIKEGTVGPTTTAALKSLKRIYCTTREET
jgi:RNA polymerase sigma factor (sigma-70 family)